MIAKIVFPCLLRKENIYGMAPAISSLVYMFVAPYLLPPEWVITDQAQDFVTHVASFAPVLHDMQQAPQYTPYWGVFYGVFLTVSLIFYPIGFVAPFVITGSYYREKKIFSYGDNWKVIVGMFLFGGASIAAYHFPIFWIWGVMMHKGAPSVITLLSLYTTSGMFYMTGVAVGIVVKKISGSIINSRSK